MPMYEIPRGSTMTLPSPKEMTARVMIKDSFCAAYYEEGATAMAKAVAQELREQFGDLQGWQRKRMDELIKQLREETK
jgi:hypothetical protein